MYLLIIHRGKKKTPKLPSWGLKFQNFLDYLTFIVTDLLF